MGGVRREISARTGAVRDGLADAAGRSIRRDGRQRLPRRLKRERIVRDLADSEKPTQTPIAALSVVLVILARL